LQTTHCATKTKQQPTQTAQPTSKPKPAPKPKNSKPPKPPEVEVLSNHPQLLIEKTNHHNCRQKTKGKKESKK